MAGAMGEYESSWVRYWRAKVKNCALFSGVGSCPAKEYNSISSNMMSVRRDIFLIGMLCSTVWEKACSRSCMAFFSSSCAWRGNERARK